MFPLYIMSGGKSSRFGSDKARALLHGKPLLVHVAETLSPLASSTVVVADQADKYADLGLETIPDLAPHLGPMGGLQTALTHFQQHHPKSDWCFLVSCDMAGLRVEWAEMLWERRSDDAQIIAFGPEPWDSMFACYRGDLLADVNRRIKEGNRAMWRLLEDVGLAQPHPEGWDCVVSINSPEALLQYVEQGSSETG